MDILYKPLESGQKYTLDLDRLTEINTHRTIALTELVYYRLHQDPVKGYMRFYRYVREATLSGDILLELQLQSELASFVAESKPEALLEEGMDPDLLKWSTVIRSVTRAWSSQQFSKVSQEADLIRQRHSDLIKATSPGSDAILSTWESYALIYQSGNENFNQAQKKLNYAIQQIEKALKSPHKLAVSVWRLYAVLGFAYRVRGYLFRVKGLMANATEDYRHAAALFRQTNLLIELATTLNDRGFAMAEQGYWADARSIVEDALDLRRHLGPRVPVALSLSTLARIDLQDGRYADAIKHAESALALFTALGDERRAGLAYTGLAEAQRRFSGELTDPDEKVKFLHEAREYARRANSIFEKVGEQYRQVEALIEEGCAARDWVKVRIDNPSGRDDVERLIKESEDSLRKAAKLAGTAVLYRKIDALVDLAWLGFYTRHNELLRTAEKEALESTPPEYLIDKKTGKALIKSESAKSLIWPQIGKLFVLRGHSAFQEYYGQESSSTQKYRQEREKELEIATENYCLGLQYSSFYSQDYHGLNLA